MPDNKYISLENLRRFKEKQDAEISSGAVHVNPPLSGNEIKAASLEIGGVNYKLEDIGYLDLSAEIKINPANNERKTLNRFLTNAEILEAKKPMCLVILGNSTYSTVKYYLIKCVLNGVASAEFRSVGEVVYQGSSGSYNTIGNIYLSLSFNNDSNVNYVVTTKGDWYKDILQDKLSYNATVPSGTTPTTLSIIKDGDNYWRIPEGGISEAVWGEIHGTLSQQTDLQTALNNKANVSQLPTKISDLTNDVGYISNVKTINNNSIIGTGDIDTTPSEMTELEVRRMFRTECDITVSITNGTYIGDSTVWTKETASVTLSPDFEYTLPSEISVTNSQYTYNNETGLVNLNNATGQAVTITAACTKLPEPTTPTLSGDTLSITEDPNADSYDIYVDGFKKLTIM